MIDINLAPENLKKKKKSSTLSAMNVPQEIVVGLVGGLLALLLFVHIILQGVIFFQFIQHARLNKEWESLKPEKENTDKILTDLRVLQTKIKNVENLTTAKRILWSKKLNDISDSIPREIWLTKVSLEEKILTIEGSAVSKNQDQMVSVGNFTTKLKEQKTFMKDFSSLEVGVMQRRKIQTTEIADFSVTAKLK